MKIGELAKLTGVSVPTIRLYEREGLIGSAARTEGGLRLFSDEQCRRLNFIKRLRNLGFQMSDVKALLGLTGAISASDGEAITRILSQISARKRDLARLESELGKILRDNELGNGLDSTFVD